MVLGAWGRKHKSGLREAVWERTRKQTLTHTHIHTHTYTHKLIESKQDEEHTSKHKTVGTFSTSNTADQSDIGVVGSGWRAAYLGHNHGCGRVESVPLGTTGMRGLAPPRAREGAASTE
jgi:hypothetical protein